MQISLKVKQYEPSLLKKSSNNIADKTDAWKS